MSYKLRSFLVLAFLLGFSSVSLAQSAAEAEQNVEEDMRSRFPDVEEYTLKNQLLNFVVTFTREDVPYTVTYTSKGSWKETIYKFPQDSLPESVKVGFDKSKYATDWEIIAVHRVESKNKEQYRVTVQKGSIQKKYLFFNENGRLRKEAITL